MAITVLIASQTDAVVASSDTQVFSSSSDDPMTVSADNLATTEEVDITYSGDGGTVFQTLYDGAGNALVLTATQNLVELPGTGIFRVAKDSTAGACAVNAVNRGNAKST